MADQLRSNRPDAGSVSRMLAAQADRLCLEILSAGRREGAEWRIGSVGNDRGRSMGVHLTGQKAGVWSDFSTGEGGDALDLVSAVMYRGDRKAAYAWALRWLGYDAHAPAPQRAYVAPKPDGEDADGKRRDAAALGLWLGAQANLGGTPAALYLAARGIDLAALGRQPRALRFHPACWCMEAQMRLPAMLALASDREGRAAAVHRTWLAQQGGVWSKAKLRDAKKSLGRVRGASIRLSRGNSGVALKDAPAMELVAIGEGIETCLSVVVLGTGLRVLCSISLANIVDLPEHISNVLLLADNDAKLKAQEGLQRAINAYASRGLTVRIARSPIGKDFNDCLRAG